MDTLIDDLLQRNSHQLTSVGRQKLVSARRFVLDAAASRIVGQAITSYPELLVRNGQFAIPPFEKTWIEFDCRALFEGLGPEYASTEDGDLQVGYLVDGNTVQIAANSTVQGSGFVPYSLVLGEPARLEDEIEFAEWFQTSRMQLDAFYWGHQFVGRLDQQTRAGLRSLGGVHRKWEAHTMDKTWKWSDRFEKQLNQLGPQMFVGGAGELRNLIAILLLLNQPSHTTYLTDVPSSRRMTARGPKPFVSYSKVQVHLGRKTPKTIFKPGSRSRDAGVRWHEVRGHFCHDRLGRARGCIHDWRETDPRRWECSKCGGKRWWRECPNGRGDSSKGIVRGMHEVSG